MPRYRTISCDHCGYMQLKSDVDCDRCGRMTKRAKTKAWVTAIYFGAVSLIGLGFLTYVEHVVSAAAR